MTVSDGFRRCQAVEYTPTPSLTMPVVPGSKVVLRDVKVLNGMLLIDRASFRANEGMVKRFYDEWKLRMDVGSSSSYDKNLMHQKDPPPPFPNITDTLKSSSSSAEAGRERKKKKREEGQTTRPPRQPPQPHPPQQRQNKQQQQQQQPQASSSYQAGPQRAERKKEKRKPRSGRMDEDEKDEAHDLKNKSDGSRQNSGSKGVSISSNSSSSRHHIAGSSANKDSRHSDRPKDRYNDRYNDSKYNDKTNADKKHRSKSAAAARRSDAPPPSSSPAHRHHTARSAYVPKQKASAHPHRSRSTHPNTTTPFNTPADTLTGATATPPTSTSAAPAVIRPITQVLLAPAPPLAAVQHFPELEGLMRAGGDGRSSDFGVPGEGVGMNAVIANVQMYAPQARGSAFYAMLTVMDQANTAMVLMCHASLFERLAGGSQAAIALAAVTHQGQHVLTGNLQTWVNVPLCCHIAVYSAGSGTSMLMVNDLYAPMRIRGAPAAAAAAAAAVEDAPSIAAAPNESNNSSTTSPRPSSEGTSVKNGRGGGRSRGNKQRARGRGGARSRGARGSSRARRGGGRKGRETGGSNGKAKKTSSSNNRKSSAAAGSKKWVKK